MYKFFQKVFEAVIEIEELIDVEGYSKPIPKSMLDGFINVGIIEENKNEKTKYSISKLIIKVKKTFYKYIYMNRYLHKHPEIFRLTKSGEINIENSNEVVSEYNVLDYFYAKLHECLLFVEKQKYEKYQDVLTGIVNENFRGTGVEKEIQRINKKIQKLNAKWKQKINIKRNKWRSFIHRRN